MKAKTGEVDFDALTVGMVGLHVNYTWRGHGSAIFVECGRLRRDPKRNHPQGDFSLMLDCGWRLETTRTILAGSYSSKRQIERAIRELKGAGVVSVSRWGTLPEIVIGFNTRQRLLSFSQDRGQPEWTVFLPDRSWLCCRRGTTIHEEAEPRRRG